MARFTGGGSGGDGVPGPTGADGASAYEIAVANGFEGTEQEWLASLGSQALPSEPLFLAMNIDGSAAWSTDGEIWASGEKLSFNGIYNSENSGVRRVSLADNYIIYLARDLDTNRSSQIWYATTYNVSPSLIEPPTSGNSYYEWNDVKFANGYTVVVGSYLNDNGVDIDPPVPAYAYTTNGLSWTNGIVDPGYQSFLTAGEFSAVEYGNDGWFITARDNSEGPASGFFITNLSDGLGEGNYVSLPTDFEDVVWTGNKWWIRENDSSTYFISTQANPLLAEWDTVDLTEVTSEFFGSGGSFYESVGGQLGSDYWFVVASNDGQVLASNDGGLSFTSSIPLPYTGTIQSIIGTEPLAVVLASRGIQYNTERISLSNANPSEYNGVYYARRIEDDEFAVVLYEDAGLTTPINASSWPTFVSADVTFSHGQYIDSIGYGLDKFIVGNDDEQLFTSTNLQSWTLRNDLNNAFDFWNDIDFNPEFGGTANLTGDITFQGVRIIGAGTASGDGNGYGTIELVPDEGRYSSDQYLIIDPTAPNHIHIRAGGEQDNSNADLILGAENTHVMVSDNNGTVSISSSALGQELSILNEATEPSLGVITYNLATLPSIGDIVNVEGTDYTVTEIDYTTEVEGQQIVYCDDLVFAPQTTYTFISQSFPSSWSFNSNGVFSGPAEGLVKTHGLYGTNDGPLVLIGPEGVVLDGDSGEFLNDASDPNNQIATIGDIGIETEFQVVGGSLGTQPTFDGSPLFSGSYVKVGPQVHFQIQVDMDNITNFGTGQYYVELPFPAKHGYKFRQGCLHDISTGKDYEIGGHVAAGSSTLELSSTDTQSGSVFDIDFTATSPVTLATADNFHISGTYIAEVV